MDNLVKNQSCNLPVATFQILLYLLIFFSLAHQESFDHRS